MMRALLWRRVDVGTYDLRIAPTGTVAIYRERSGYDRTVAYAIEIDTVDDMGCDWPLEPGGQAMAGGGVRFGPFETRAAAMRFADAYLRRVAARTLERRRRQRVAHDDH